MTNTFHKMDDKMGYRVRSQDCEKPLWENGGRCRARTYDPLIKSQRADVEFAAFFVKTEHSSHKSFQALAGEIQNDSRAFPLLFRRAAAC